MKITEILVNPKEHEITRVAAYARVSSDKDAAFHSLEAQTAYYEKYVTDHPDWQLVGIYSDNGISGTTINRPEFQRMLEDCRAGKIDLVLTKSVTRFARNTVILLEAIRELKKLNVDCYFEKENMHSISPDGELLLTLLAMYAEEEARSASENQRWRIQKRFQNGEPWVGRMLGYRLEQGKLVVVEDEAELVQQIFQDYLSGMSVLAIAKRLNALGIPSPTSGIWGRSTVYHILTNEKYTGNMVLQKTYRPDFRTKKGKINQGQVAKYEVTGSHEAIISETDFAAVQENLQLSRKNYPNVYRGGIKYLFSGLIKCGCCGGCYIHKMNGTGKYKHPVWICRRFAELGKAVCPAKGISEPILIEKTKEVLSLGVDDTLSREYLLEKLSEITVAAPHQLIYHLRDGTEITVEWHHKSRSESWTPEMREKARERAIKQRRKEREQYADS